MDTYRCNRATAEDEETRAYRAENAQLLRVFEAFIEAWNDDNFVGAPVGQIKKRAKMDTNKVTEHLKNLVDDCYLKAEGKHTHPDFSG